MSSPGRNTQIGYPIPNGQPLKYTYKWYYTVWEGCIHIMRYTDTYTNTHAFTYTHHQELQQFKKWIWKKARHGRLWREEMEGVNDVTILSSQKWFLKMWSMRSDICSHSSILLTFPLCHYGKSTYFLWRHSRLEDGRKLEEMNKGGWWP